MPGELKAKSVIASIDGEQIALLITTEHQSIQVNLEYPEIVLESLTQSINRRNRQIQIRKEQEAEKRNETF